MELSFEQLPTAVSRLYTKLENIERLLQFKNEPAPADQWFDLKALENYHPEKLARATLYNKLAKGEFPGHKKGKKWFFLKSEIDAYLMAGRKQTTAEIEAETDAYLANKKPVRV